MNLFSCIINTLNESSKFAGNLLRDFKRMFDRVRRTGIANAICNIWIPILILLNV